MEARGVRFHSQDRTRALVASLDEHQRVFLADCVRRVQAGVEQASEFQAVAAIGYCTSDEVAARLEQCGLGLATPRSVYMWVLSDEGALRKLFSAAAGDEQQRVEIAALLRVGVAMGNDGVADDGERGFELTAPSEVKVDDASGIDGKRRTRKKASTDWGGQDKAKSYARDAPEVKAAASAKHHVYVKTAGLTFELDRLRREEEGRRFTVRVEGAKAGDGRGYDWLNKTVVQLTAGELHQAAAVVLGMSESMVATHHGDQRDKGIEIRRDGGSVMVRLTRPGSAIAVGVGADHLYKVALVFMRALTLNDPDVDPRVLLDTLRLTSSVVRAGEK